MPAADVVSGSGATTAATVVVSTGVLTATVVVSGVTVLLTAGAAAGAVSFFVIGMRCDDVAPVTPLAPLTPFDAAALARRRLRRAVRHCIALLSDAVIELLEADDPDDVPDD